MRMDYQRARRQLLGLLKHRHVESSADDEGSEGREGAQGEAEV
jgi:hypothetical protein